MDLLAVLPSESAVRTLTPDLGCLARLPVRGVIVTAAGAEVDFVSRFFAPQAGVPEDPVTGSAHCCLGPYWRERLGKDRLVGYQASRRGGTVAVECVGERVLLGGQAVLVLEGVLRV
jgi:predicted PhzF superfamily epimerase YddE/YHI9